MDIFNLQNTNGAAVQIWQANNTNAQRFWILQSSGVWRRIVPVFSTTHVLDVRYASRNPGTLVNLWQYGGAAHQHFEFVPVQQNCNHLWITAITISATCYAHGTRRLVCGNCSATRTEPTPMVAHTFSHNVCVRYQRCGRLNTSNSSHFTHYMYRRGNHARHLTRGWVAAANHFGLDIVYGPSGTTTSIDGMPIFAQGNGVVERRSDSPYHDTRGHFIIIRYDHNNYIARYLHLQSRPTLAVGTRVNHTTRLGFTGNTGYSTGPHLHFDVNNRNIIDGGQSANHLNPINLFPANTFQHR